MNTQLLSHVRLFGTPWTVAHQAPLCMGFPRQGYWCGLPFPSPGNLPHPGIEPASLTSPAVAVGLFTTEPLGSWNKASPQRLFLYQISIWPWGRIIRQLLLLQACLMWGEKELAGSHLDIWRFCKLSCLSSQESWTTIHSPGIPAR